MLFLLIIFKLSAGQDAIICSIMITDLLIAILEVSKQNSLNILPGFVREGQEELMFPNGVGLLPGLLA